MSIGHFYFAQIGHYHFAATPETCSLCKASENGSLTYSVAEGSKIVVKAHFLLLFAISGTSLRAEPALVDATAVVQNYVAASQQQQRRLNGASMQIEIDASLPKLNKQGRLQALRRISELGRITYEALRFEGDGTVKTNLIARYLAAETQSQDEPAAALAVTTANYKFRHKATMRADGRTTYIFQVTPRKKRVGLFKGEIWIDGETFLRVREASRFVQNPSVFLKRVEFVRIFDIVDGVAVPREIDSTVETRLVGPAELKVAFTNVSLGAQRSANLTEVGVH